MHKSLTTCKSSVIYWFRRILENVIFNYWSIIFNYWSIIFNYWSIIFLDKIIPIESPQESMSIKQVNPVRVSPRKCINPKNKKMQNTECPTKHDSCWIVLNVFFLILYWVLKTFCYLVKNIFYSNIFYFEINFTII